MSIFDTIKNYISGAKITSAAKYSGTIPSIRLKKTNAELIATLEEVTKIQNDGRVRRAEAETELEKIEGALKQKLLEMKG